MTNKDIPGLLNFCTRLKILKKNHLAFLEIPARKNQKKILTVMNLCLTVTICIERNLKKFATVTNSFATVANCMERNSIRITANEN